jgi:hypothetical protein
LTFLNEGDDTGLSADVEASRPAVVQDVTEILHSAMAGILKRESVFIYRSTVCKFEGLLYIRLVWVRFI